MADDIRDVLRGGDRRSIGRVPQVLNRLTASPRLFDRLVAALGDTDPVVRMRAADALEKASRKDASPLQKHKRALLRLARSTAQQELRWHLAQMLPRLHLRPPERQAAARTLQSYHTDPSSIVRTFALQALADLAQGDAALRALALRSLRQAIRTGTPAMRSRAARLLRELAPPGARPRVAKENHS
ncbi:MAG: hypothetical protein A2Z30_05925 [Chloroflexi bacterium RBG_16_64_43]|nr:MAG: hypothetical protein A2Z30_05925 [Chloroflexi bacterium RBG_16_64_43]